MFREVYDLVYWNEYLFNQRVVGLQVKSEIWKEGFCYQEIILDRNTFRFIFTDLGKFRPFFFTREKALKYIQELFAFVPEEAKLTDFSALKIFDKPVCKWLGAPLQEKENTDGVFFITTKGEKLFFPKEKGKKIAGKLTFTLMHPLPPYACLYL